MKRVILIVLDSVGVGALPDASLYGDEGANTLMHISQKERLFLPNLESLGLGNLGEFENVNKSLNAAGCFGKMKEASKGKDTITGHWEMTGIILDNPFPTYPDGFPESVINGFTEITGYEVLGNKPASGTEIIAELGQEHMDTGKIIVYTSADSVFQIAAHEDVVELDKLYRVCEEARKMLKGEHGVGRVIARPFRGDKENGFVRTAHRKDFPLLPERNMLEILKDNGLQVKAVGKIEDIFAGKGITESSGHNRDNDHGVANTVEFIRQDFEGLIFTNLVDFDMEYGHRNDHHGYAKALEQFDSHIPEIIKSMKYDDILIITADHGCDPCFPGTDHTREYVPLLITGSSIRKGVDLYERESFSDISATILEFFDIEEKTSGNSFWREISKDGRF